ncbi:hypothetical protein ACQUWM_12290 [Marinobacter sp. DUT-3]|uniref:hypothetical protein n=1 Tax=Marinobacter sp. DUT-3 TaxID=3412036 RepID=UPI003D16AC30
MDEKYIFALFGIALGAVLSAVFSIVRELYAEWRSKKKEAEYLAIRMICIFDSFMEGCALVVGDDGLCHGQPDSEGYSRIQVSAPTLDVQLMDVNWKSFPPKLMYEILYFPNLIKDAESFISSTFEYAASPPDYSEGFEERQHQYSLLGIKASELTAKLRKKYSIPKNHISSWDIVEYMHAEQDKIKQLRIRREKANSEMLSKIHP